MWVPDCIKHVMTQGGNCCLLAGVNCDYLQWKKEEERNVTNSILSHHVPQQDLEDPDDPVPDFTARPKHLVKLKCPRGKSNKGSGSSKQHPLSCRHCRKTFTKLLQLRAHLAVHGASTEKPFHCSQCGRGFSFEHSLSAHMMLHTGDNLAKFESSLDLKCGCSTNIFVFII